MLVYRLNLDAWEEDYFGLFIAENVDWLLLSPIHDYAIDGYKLFSKKFITSQVNSKKERELEKVLKLKNIEVPLPLDFEFGSSLEILNWLEAKYGIFEFQDDVEDELFFGKVKKVENNNLVIDFINSKGIIDNDFDCVFELDAIRTIAFGSVYFNTIRLLHIEQSK